MKKPISNILKNISLLLLSLIFALFLGELFVRNSKLFQHGGDREPRNDRAIFFKKNPYEKRIAVIGDSLTFGDGVKSIETYPYKLQEKLNSTYGKSYKVLNLGIMGINTDEQMANLVNYNPYFKIPVLAFDPDIVIHTFCINDIELMPDPKPRPEFVLLPLKVQKKLLNFSALYRFFNMNLNQAMAALGYQKTYAEYIQEIYRKNKKEWQLFNYYISFIINTVKKNNKKFLLVIFPSMEHFGDSHPFLDLYDKVEKIGRSHGIEVLNLYPFFLGENASSLRVSLLNGHPNAKAYEIAADAIFNTLNEKGFLETGR